jgi:hypothetical protein
MTSNLNELEARVKAIQERLIEAQADLADVGTLLFGAVVTVVAALNEVTQLRNDLEEMRRRDNGRSRRSEPPKA